MKIYEIWTSNLHYKVQDRSKKNSFIGSCPGVISFRLSNKRARSVKHLKSSSGTDGRTENTSKFEKIRYCPRFVCPSVCAATTFQRVHRSCPFMAQSKAYDPRAWTKEGIFLDRSWSLKLVTKGGHLCLLIYSYPLIYLYIHTYISARFR